MPSRTHAAGLVRKGWPTGGRRLVAYGLILARRDEDGTFTGFAAGDRTCHSHRGLRLPPSDTHTTLISGCRRVLHTPPLTLRSPAHPNPNRTYGHFSTKPDIRILASRAELGLLAQLA